MASQDFCHLHVHTQYSLLDGACRIEPMAERARELGMPAVAMTDHGSMFGAVEFHKGMRAAGVKPIIGYEGYFTPGSRTTRDRSVGQELYHLTFLAADQAGYRNLIKMSSLAYLEGLYYKPRVDWDLLEDCAEGVICLSGCLHSRLNSFLLAEQADEAEKWAGELRDLFGPDRFYVELQDHGLADQKKVLRPAVELARRLDVPVVATNDCHYLSAADRSWHEVLLCINTRTTLDDPNRFQMQTDQLYFRSRDEMAESFGDLPEALSNTMRIAEMCNVELDVSRKYPSFHYEGVTPEENGDFLRRLTEERLTELYGELRPEMKQRLEYELSVIGEMGYVDYFLIVWDFVRFAREHDIPVGLRGSSAGCLVNHALGITDLNPLDYDLIFERFLDPERKEAPDIDIDLCELRREEVIDYVRQRYGQQSTAQIITFGTLKARNCVRDVGRVLGVDLGTVDKVAKLLPQGPGATLKGALASNAELRAMAEADGAVAQMLDFAEKIEGLPRHASTHAAGVVIADRPLWETVPLYKMADGEAMTQWPMDDLAAVGMLKMDFLGLRALTIIDRTVSIIRAAGREAPSLHPGKMDLRDEKTYSLISEGLTQGIFQLGSGGMQRMLRRLEPRNLEDLIAAVALYRPGPLQSGMVDDFIDCRHGRRESTFPHPAFAPILEPTYGVIVYQEQIMRICNKIAGMKLGDALTMIKAISKKSEAKVRRYHEDFVKGAVANGVEQGTAEEVFGLIMHFAGYGFNKAHTSAYAFLSFVTAYLKAHYTTEFMAASISCEMDKTDEVVALMEECAKLGIEVLPPDINESQEEFTRLSEGRLRFGLGAVKNVGSKAVQCIVDAREKGGPFTSLFDFCERIDPHEVTKGAIEGLMKAGCFDGLPGHRGQQLALLDTALKVGAQARKNRLAGQKSLFGAVTEEDPEKRMAANLPEVPPLGQRELARQEYEALGLYVRYDPLAESRTRLARFSTVTGDQLEGLADEQEVVIGGMIEEVQRRTTRSNDAMAVLKVLGVKSVFECVLFPRAFSEFRELVEPGAVLFFAGRVSHRRTTSVQAEALIPLDKAQARLAESLFIAVPADGAGEELWTALKAVLDRHSGGVPVYVDIEAEGYRLCTRVSNGTAVTASDKLAEEIEALVGPGSVRFSISLVSARPRGNGRGRRSRNGAKGYADSRN